MGGALWKSISKSNNFLVSLTTSYFSSTTLKSCQDFLYIVYIRTGAPRRSWRQIVYLVDGVDLTSDPRHANPTRSLLLGDAALDFLMYLSHNLKEEYWLMKLACVVLVDWIEEIKCSYQTTKQEN